MSDHPPGPASQRPFDDERKFIHDLSTPLTTAQLLLETAIENLAQGPDGAQPWVESEVARLRRTMEVLHRVNTKLQERRSTLIAASEAKLETDQDRNDSHS